MHFVSIEWLFWVAAAISFYWLAPRDWRDRVLVALTLALLLVHSPLSAALLTGLALTVFYLSKVRPLSGWRALLAGGVVFGVLIYFKTGVDLTEPNGLSEIAVPLGLAYYAIRLILYIIDSYTDTVPEHRFEHFVSYLFFLPTIVVGPIHRFNHFLSDYQYKRWDARNLSEGLQRIIYGYVKIVVLGNYLISVVFADFIGSLGQEDLALRYYLEIVRQGLNLYLQFSGFSDIAIGFALILGYRIMENFHWPFLQTNISDFWRCWHISLTSFAREHIYRVIFSVSRNAGLSVLGTMLFIALWHELSLRYVVWGFYHFAGIMVWQLSKTHVSPHLPSIETAWLARTVDGVKIFATANFVWFSFVIVRQPDLASTLDVYRTIFSAIL